MELRIKINKENKEKIFRLINAYLEEEVIFEVATSPPNLSVKGDYLTIPPDVPNLENKGIFKYGNNEDIRIGLVGTWGQFNSFFPIKGALRVLANSLIDNNVNYLNFRDFVFHCIDVFNKTRIRNKTLAKFRGFPRSKKDTAIGRFVWHFLTSAHEMGLIIVRDYDGNLHEIPRSLNDWDKVKISITQSGLTLAQLENPLFDRSNLEQVLGNAETAWLLDFLEKKDNEGFREFSLLRDIYDFIQEGYNGKDDLWSWFEHDERFIEYIKSWSRKCDEPEALQEQIKNLSKTYSASKIALLRELGLIENKRGDYSIIKKW